MNSKRLIPRLLAGKNQLSRPEKDEIFANVLGEVGRPRRSGWWRPGVWVAVTSVAAILVIVPVVVKNEGGKTRDGKNDTFTARGAASAVAGFDLACSGSESLRCQSGGHLLFDLQKSTGYRYFAAFARRNDGAVIWYFPESPEGQSLDLSAARPTAS